MDADRAVRVRVDYENNAEEWWTALREKYPEVAYRFRLRDEITLDESMLLELRALPGWRTGPEHARTPLVEVTA